MAWRIINGLIVSWFFMLWCYGAQAEKPTVKELLEKRERTEAVIEQLDSQARLEPGVSPLMTVVSIIDAVERKDWQKASSYLDMRYLPEELKGVDPVLLIQRLEVIWSQNQVLDLSVLSPSPEGNLDDGLPSYRDLLGTIPLDGKRFPIYLQRIPDGEGGQTWKVSNATVAKIPALWETYGYHPLVLKLADYLPAFTFLHMQNWQFVGLLLIIAFAWFGTAFVRWVLLRSMALFPKYSEQLQRFFTVPLRWFLFFKSVEFGVAQLGLPLRARVYFNENSLSYMASLFLVLAAIELSTAIFLSNASNKKYWSGIIRPVRTILKIIAIVTIVLLWLKDAGYDISTLLAGLGIGSLALALAAQKTLENVIGAVTLYVAKPIAPGDFCKFGDISGTVEEIGLRSTAIRRLDRTLVHVPNSAIVGVNLENISETDRRRFHKKLWIAHTCSADQLRYGIVKMRELLWSHPRVSDIALRVRLEEIERDAYRIGLNAYIDTVSLVDFQAVSEDLNLRLIGVLEQAGLSLAKPQQIITVQRPDKVSAERACELKENAEAEIKAMVDNDALAFPDFPDDIKPRLRGTISYPEKGHPDPAEEPSPIPSSS